MIFKKKEKESKPKKEKKLPVMKVGTHKKSVIVLWIVLLTSVSFGVYKNFTAIDMHTVQRTLHNIKTCKPTHHTLSPPPFVQYIGS